MCVCLTYSLWIWKCFLHVGSCYASVVAVMRVYCGERLGYKYRGADEAYEQQNN